MSLIQSIINTSKAVFRRNPSKKLEKREIHPDLLRQVNKVTAEELGLDKSPTIMKYSSTSSSSSSRYDREPPFTYVEIFESSDISVGIFILKSGARIPLHNHPRMHGILKCVYGELMISSYTVFEEENYDDETRLIEALKHEDAFLSSDSESVFLTPEKRNLHEVINCSANGEPAAFMDILAPPYNSQYDYELGNHHDVDEEDIRVCNFYKVEKKGSDKVWLRVIDPPADYSCLSETYRGPEVQV